LDGTWGAFASRKLHEELSESLLRSRAEVLAEAYDLQAKRVAYVERAGTEAAMT
jgi:hypothetical protein